MAEPRYPGTAKPDFRIHIISSQILCHPPVSTQTGMGRAVAASYLKEIENGRFGIWDEREWWIKGWPTDWQDE